MAHLNEFTYLQRFLLDWPASGWPASLKSGRILNCGTAHGAIDYGPLFPGHALVGVDQVKAPGVDVVCDLTGDCAALQGERFAAILCCSVLEHCAQPWLASANLAAHLAPQGLLYVTVPWIWRTHAYPLDYWRVSDDGMRLLFPTVTWKRVDYLTQVVNEIVPLAAASDAPWRILKGERVYLASQMLCMIGRAA